MTNSLGNKSIIKTNNKAIIYTKVCNSQILFMDGLLFRKLTVDWEKEDIKIASFSLTWYI